MKGMYKECKSMVLLYQNPYYQALAVRI